MVPSCSLRFSIVFAFCCRLGASLIYSIDPDHPISERSSENGQWPWPEDKMGCNHTGWKLLDQKDLRTQYEDMILRMQGKSFVFAGDSLMDMVFHPFFCSAKVFGWQVSDVPIGTFATRADTSAGCMAKMFTKANHKPIVMAFMRFYNYKFGDASVKLDDVFHFPITPSNFDVAFVNLAHNAMFKQDKKKNIELADQLISSAHRASNVGRVVFLGHPPQHFKSATGEYTGPEAGACMCHDKAAMEKQPIFGHNLIVEIEVNKDNARPGADGKCAFANPWSYYADKCDNHGHLYGHGWEDDKADCTHWLEDDVASHAPFLRDLVATAGL